MTDARLAPDVDYLTRDYEGFRQLLLSLLDRSGTRWTERAAADSGVMLLEILAQQLDLLAYAGDRVAEEAFLGTARGRESVRRHAVLGDHVLDRGSATVGHQHFQLATGRTLLLCAGARVGQRLPRGEDPARRLIAETTEDAFLDARRNELFLARSAPLGGSVLHLADLDGHRVDPRAIGLWPGMRLCVADRDGGEVITLRATKGDAVELAAPLSRTYVASSAGGGPRVFGNLVPIRRGMTLPWALVGRGGAALTSKEGGDVVVPAARYLALRLEVVRRLRDEVEAARPLWIGDASLPGLWQLANATAARVARVLREWGGTSPSPTTVEALHQDLVRVADKFRDILKWCGRTVPPEFLPSERNPLPGQQIALRGELPPLWLDGVQTLKVLVGVEGRWEGWTEVEDLLRSGPSDRHYVAEIDADGQVTLRFGDSVNGAVLPADSRVMVQRVVGDLGLADLGAGALDVLIDSGDPGAPLDRSAFDASKPTWNPLSTHGGRVPEALEGIAQRVRRELQRRVVPVTVFDYEAILSTHAGIAETRATAARGRVEVVLCPRPETDASQVLKEVRGLLREERLAGTDVWVRLAEPLYVSLVLLVDVDPKVSPSDLRLRLRARLLELFATPGEKLLGRARTRAEVYAAVEAVPGVTYSEVLGFDLASAADRLLSTLEEIVPAPHEIVRCLDLVDRPLAGSITLWSVRRFHLLVELAYADPDDRPDFAQLQPIIARRLSGSGSVPVQEGWEEVTPARIDSVLRVLPPPGARYRLAVRRLMVGESAVERVPLGADELPVLDFVRAIERPFLPHFGLVLALSGNGPRPSDEALRAALAPKLSGPESVPVVEQWPELTPVRIASVIASLTPGFTLTVRTLTVDVGLPEGRPTLPPRVDDLGTRRVVSHVPLNPGDVPILDLVQVAFDPGVAP